ncbi:MBL fold metallo-hydrolase [Sulfitobacter sp. JBTF-M27]|uniref:MBL fold metallo-hydrolase n=1 Tax=Sulfitobacter sediminilitoris TaxID=2698830 RepID=A0A6P0CJJ0_9RHOB|nr:MBL fold metallo-hydrolase [Sulfitobacter sediminilitoris]NEK24614.1 MBL fold metallo-hydrolase [Sulfitobacter sediminilitoris]
MKLTILGSGSPEAYARRASSGYLVEIGRDRILFDCGGGVFDNLLRSGRLPSDITHIIFSHLHSDHMMDYARLVHAAWDEGGAPIQVYGPAPIKAITDGYFGPEGVLSHDLRARTELPQSQEVWLARGGTLPRPWPEPVVREITPGQMMKGDGWQIQSCQAPHAQPFLECMAFSLTTADKKFVYSGDAGLCPAVETICQNADFLLHWCYRLDGEDVNPKMAATTPTPSEIGAMAKRVGARALMLTHFRKHMDEPKRFDRAIQAASDTFGRSVTIAEDLQLIQI